MLSSSECLLPFQETLVQTPALRLSGSRQPITHGARGSVTFYLLSLGTGTHVATPINKNKT